MTPELAADAVALERQADRLAELGDGIRAEQYYAAALAHGADVHRVLPRLIRVCVQASRFRAALTHAEPLLRAAPDDAELRFVVATLYLGLGAEDEARQHLEHLLRLVPEHADAHYLLGAVLAKSAREPETASRHLEAYLQLSPSGRHAAASRELLASLQAQRLVEQLEVSGDEGGAS